MRSNSSQLIEDLDQRSQNHPYWKCYQGLFSVLILENVKLKQNTNSVNFSDLTFAIAQVRKHGGKVEIVGIVSNGAETICWTSRISGVLPLNSYNIQYKGAFCQVDHSRACLRAGPLETVTREYITFVSHSHLEVSTFGVA